jgi:hypothetical protein
LKVIPNLNAISEHVRTKEVCIYCDKNMKKSHSRALKEIKPNKKPFLIRNQRWPTQGNIF